MDSFENYLLMAKYIQTILSQQEQSISSQQELKTNTTISSKL